VKALTPKEIVDELDRHIVGQTAAKRAVAIALRNRWRRQQVAPEMRDDITPKNIILIGPTGVGKTEIARRLAKLAQAPFVKVEASKFTEVGYVGRDVESMVRELVEASISLVRDEEAQKVRVRATEAAEDRLQELLQHGGAQPQRSVGFGFSNAAPASAPRLSEVDREKLRAKLSAGTLDDTEVEIDVQEAGVTFIKNFSGQGMEEVGLNLQDLFKSMPGMGGRSRKRKLKVPEAFKLLEGEESQRLVDPDRINREAISRAENHGIIFLDELDKI
jgi:ATP-dependent HslUV protease ATP-binding subunit HslU